MSVGGVGVESPVIARSPVPCTPSCPKKTLNTLDCSSLVRGGYQLIGIFKMAQRQHDECRIGRGYAVGQRMPKKSRKKARFFSRDFFGIYSILHVTVYCIYLSFQDIPAGPSIFQSIFQHILEYMIVPNGVPRPPALHAVCTVPHGAEKQAGWGWGSLP